MAGLLSGLEKLGLGNLQGMNLYEQPEEKKEENKEPAKPEIKEEEVLFDKTYECPVCYKQFKGKTLKSGKVKLVKTDMDLRPVYEGIEPLKYDVLVCPHCGYAVLTRFFQGLAPTQIKLVKEKICASYKGHIEEKETYTYEEALERYQLCLANTIVKMGKTSEKAYICLKAGWLLRSMAENMDSSLPDYAQKQKEAKAQSDEYLKNALEGFMSAIQSENFPMCGMDELTVDYLIAVLATEYDKLDVASKLVSQIIVSPTANSRMKDKAREVKEILVAKIKEKNAH